MIDEWVGYWCCGFRPLKVGLDMGLWNNYYEVYWGDRGLWVVCLKEVRGQEVRLDFGLVLWARCDRWAG